MNPYDGPEKHKIERNGRTIRTFTYYTFNQVMRFAEQLAIRNRPSVYLIYTWSYRNNRWYESGGATARR